jgi:YVTN family beta-propeller protein
MRRTYGCLAVSLALFCLSGTPAIEARRARIDESIPQGKLSPPRRPIALALADGGKTLLVANRAGTVSVLDLAAGRVSAEVKVGRRLADVAATSDGRRLLVADEGGDELVLLERGEGLPKVVQRVKVSLAPVSVRVSADGKWASVASLWGRRLTLIDLDKDKASVAKTIDLPFAPREQVVGEKVVVADSFGGRLAVVDTQRGVVESVRTFPGHNVRGLALDGKQLLIAHQVLNPQATATRDDVHWGNLLTNNVRAVPLTTVLDPKADLLKDDRLYQLGDVGAGAADPAGLAVRAEGDLVVTLGGVDEVGLRTRADNDWTRVQVGRRPTAVVLSPDGRQAYVANTFADSLSVLDLENKKAAREIALGSAAEPAAAERGERLFYDANLSHDRWLSCHSCHVDGHTNGLLADTLGDGTYGTPKRVLSLLGVRDTAPYAWNGSMADLKSQIRKSVETTMHGRKPTEEQVADLEAYLRSLPPPPPLRHGENEAVRRGQALFDKQGCNGCHAPPTYTSAKTYDVGLTDEAGAKTFNPPSLRGVGQGGPYFHDGRALVLEDVVGRFKHQIKGELTKGEIADLMAFLRSL